MLTRVTNPPKAELVGPRLGRWGLARAAGVVGGEVGLSLNRHLLGSEGNFPYRAFALTSSPLPSWGSATVAVALPPDCGEV